MTEELLPAPHDWGSVTNVVYKYRMTDVVLRVPNGRVRHVGTQFIHDEMPTVWIEHNLASVDRGDGPEQELIMVGTGHPFHPGESEFIGTAICANGALVWHVYSRLVS